MLVERVLTGVEWVTDAECGMTGVDFVSEGVDWVLSVGECVDRS